MAAFEKLLITIGDNRKGRVQMTPTEHYSDLGLLGRVEQGLQRAGLDSGRATWEDFASIDQFHVLGLISTEEMAAALNCSSESSVLDVGCGLGGPARYLAAVRGCRVTGIDLSQPFIDVARFLTARAGLADRIDFRQGDALNLPFADQSFDHAWTQHVAMNIADRDALYSSIARVLKPGGRLAIYDVVAGDGSPLLFPVPWARTPEISFLVSAQQMRDALRGAGFVELSSSDKTVAGIAWFEQQMARRVQGPPPDLGLDVVLGPEFAQMAANLVSNLKEGRARLLQLLAEKR